MKTARKIFHKYGLMLLTPIVTFLILCVIFPEEITKNNIPTLLRQSVAPSILGWGVLFNMNSGNWDFSVGSVAILSAVIGGNLALKYNLGIVGLFALCMMVGALAGTVTGTVYYLLKIPTIITSIGMLLIYESIGSYIYDGGGIYLPSTWPLFNYVTLYVVAIIIALFAFILYYKTKIGYNIRAVGSNPTIAASNGLDVYKVKVTGLIVAALFSGIYAAVNLEQAGVQRPVSSMSSTGTCFDAMMCVFVGKSISRKGNVIAGLYCGSLVCQLIKLCLIVIGFPSQYNSIIIAVLVIIFMSLDSIANSREARKRKILEAQAV